MPDLLAIVDGQEAALLSHEKGAAAVASAPLRAKIAQIVAQALAAFELLGPDDDREPLLRRVREQLLALGVNVTDSLLSDFIAAQALGIEHGNAQALDVEQRIRPVHALPADVLDVTNRTNITAREKLIDAASKLTGISTLPDLLAGLARANMAVTAIEQAAKWGVNRSVASGVASVASAVGASRLWTGERDACLHCTAYMGQVADNDLPFVGGLTFAKKPLSTAPVPNPPLHPNCRCRISLYRHEWSRPGQVSIPDALKREARRSVARGFSLPTESEAARLSAADRLLLRGAGLPRTVEERARRDVEAGEFRRGRNVP